MINFQEKVNFIWSLADLLRGVYKRNEYQKIILPLTVLKRFDCVLIDTKKDILKAYNKYKNEFENLDDVLMTASRHSFYNYSKYDFKSLLEDPELIKDNLLHYMESFSQNVKDIFENFKMREHITELAKADLLYLLIKEFSESKVDLHPDKVSNQEMGTIYEELVRRFSEQSNEEAGDHFTPREVVKLMTHLMFASSKEEIMKKDLIKTVYDPACGTGGMLTGSENYINSINKDVKVVLFGQELQPETFAVCKSDMLIKGEGENKITGPLSTLSKDQFPDMKFDYIISNPPYGVEWKKDEDAIKKEAEYGFSGRFGAGLPRINDGQLLFIEHMISKMNTKDEKSRIAVITNGSPLFTGDAGSGESNIRKWIMENDLIEAIIALPDQLFYNTGINTYIWIMSNKKNENRRGKIQLVDAKSFFEKMRKSLGNKRNKLSDRDIEAIVKLYDDFEENKYCRIFDNQEFGYTKVIVERPLQLNYQIAEERLENLYSVKAFASLAESKNKNPEEKLEEEKNGKEKQKIIINALQTIGDNLYKNWDEFEKKVQIALKEFGLSVNFIKNIILALSEHDDTADYVLDAIGHKLPDSNLRDPEKIPLKQDIKEYFDREVKPYYLDAWMDRKKDKIGYEINFSKYFYKYVPPRPLEEIEKDIKEVTAEIQELLKEEL
jgi:type I restriction enzyme M protein